MALTLWEVLGAVPDRRGRKGRQLPLRGVLAIAIAAMLAGANDLRAIFRWGRRLKREALALFGIGRAPCHATYFYVFRSLDGDALARALGSFAGGTGAPGHIAIDGKTLRGSRRVGSKALHVVSAFASQLSAVVGDLAVAPDENEIVAALALLKGGTPLTAGMRYGLGWTVCVRAEQAWRQGRQHHDRLRDSDGSGQSMPWTRSRAVGGRAGTLDMSRSRSDRSSSVAQASLMSNAKCNK